ncbi:MAG: GNAT family N-acetyltransferase [Saprospiraceae bacterium]|nr:GNAT family N-acetyltransferase [Saprospiraceae bacterium]
MQHHLTTERLVLNSVTPADAGFVLELVNTPGWLKFIGDRQVHDLAAAEAYAQKMSNTENANSWVVRLRDGKTPIGVVSFLQRDYLEYRDIGFAFLPGYGKQGYAFEAASAVLNSLMEEGSYPCIYATTLPGNVNSIQLLEKLGLHYERMIRVGEEDLRLYAIKK